MKKYILQISLAILTMISGFLASEIIIWCISPKITYPDGSSIETLVSREKLFLNGGKNKTYLFTTIYGYYDDLVLSKPEELIYCVIAANKYGLPLGYPKVYDIISDIEESITLRNNDNSKNTILFLHRIALDFLMRGCKNNKGGCEGIIYGNYIAGEDYFDQYLDSIVYNYK